MENNNRGSDRGFGGNRGGGARFGGNRGGSGFSRGGFGGNKFGGDRDRGNRPPVVMNDAVCAECHKQCQVPFRPSGDKPVYCNDCFRGQNGPSERPSFNNAPRKEYNKPQAQVVISQPSNNQNDLKKQLDAMNVKLDSLIRTVEAMTKPKVVVSAPVEIKTTEKKAKKAKKVSKK